MTNLKTLLVDFKRDDYKLGLELHNRKSHNTNDGLIFEDIFMERLTDHGFEEVSNTILKKRPDFKKELLSTQELSIDNSISDVVGNGSFIAQPFGSQSFPDFIIFDCDKVICVELKYSKHSKPMWNNSLPRQHTLYVFLSNSMTTGSQLVLFKGCDVISPDMERVLKQYGKQAQELANEAHEIFESLDEFGYGFNLYNRINFNQSKYNDTTNTSFLNNKHRQVNDDRVIQFLDEI